MRNLRTTIPLVLATTIMLMAGCSGKQDPTILGSSPLVIGVANDGPGFAVGSLHPAGFDIDLAQAIGDSLGKVVTTTPITSDERGSDLETHHVSLVVDTYSITSARNRAGIDFAGPYMVSTQALLVRASDKSITSKDSVKGKSICTVATTTGASVPIPGANLSDVRPTTKDCVSDLLAGNTDAVFTDTLLLYGYVNAFKGRLRVVLPGVFGELQYYGVGLPAHHHADCLKLDHVISGFLQTQWRTDFLADLPAAAAAYSGSDTNDGDFESQFRPSDSDMNALSCKL